MNNTSESVSAWLGRTFAWTDDHRMRANSRLFVILWLAGFAGVLSILLIDIASLVTILPVSAAAQLSSIPPLLLKPLSVVQPTMLLTVAVAIGVALASTVALSSPVAEAVANGTDVMPAFKRQLIPGVVGGVLGGTMIVLITVATKPFLSQAVLTRLAEFGRVSPLPMRLLYGGITEELLLRWGFMTLLVWLAWRLLQRGHGRPRARYVVGAIVVSSLVFGAGHLPLAFLIFSKPSIVLIIFVIIANSAFGMIAGFLYWKSGLEAAVVAHVTTHLVMFAASRVGAYF